MSGDSSVCYLIFPRKVYSFKPMMAAGAVRAKPHKIRPTILQTAVFGSWAPLRLLQKVYWEFHMELYTGATIRPDNWPPISPLTPLF